MDRVSFIEKIKTNSNLFSLPQVLSEVIKETAKDDFSPNKLGDIILKDPSLTGRILKMANSSFYNRYVEIKTVHQAISVMGATTVKCLALSSSIFHPEKISKASGVDPKEFFAYILSVAAACKKIADAVGFESPEEAFIAGLLHDIGHLYYMHYYPAQVKQVIESASYGKSLIEKENEIFGIDHTDVAYYIAKTWKLPDEITTAIGNHHDFISNDNNVLQNIVRLSVLLTRDRFTGYEISLEDRLACIASMTERLHLKTEDVDEISSSLLTDTFEIAEYLGVNIGDIEKMLTIANKEIWKSYLFIENLFKERQELSKSLLEQERERGAIESKNIAMATLSHYLNNAVMAIFGRTQIVRLHLEKGRSDKVLEHLPDMIEKIDESVRKIIAVIEEMKEVSPIDQKKFDSMSKAMNIDDRIKSRLARMEKESPKEDIITI